MDNGNWSSRRKPSSSVRPTRDSVATFEALEPRLLLSAAPLAGALSSVDPNILWHNDSTGQNIIWLMSGTNLAGGSWLPTVSDTNWEIAGTGDFDGNGSKDILWHNYSTGQNIIWLMNGTDLAGGAWLPTVSDLNWDISGVADLDGNGKPDILWRNDSTGENIIWLMNGTNLAGGAWLQTVSDTNWYSYTEEKLDADGDGTDDIFWLNETTGQMCVWLVKGGSPVGQAWLPTVSDTNWEIDGLADFNHDGTLDVLWRNYSTGQDLIWVMAKPDLATSSWVMANGVWLQTVSDTNWNIENAGADFDANGTNDILWHNYSTDQNIIWQMSGTSLAGGAWLPVTDSNWETEYYL